MQISPIIARLRTVLTSWSNRIYGAAEYEAVEDRARLPIPAMYVMYDGCTAKTISHHSTFEQEYEDRLKILVVLDNTADRTGKNAQDQVHTVRAAIWSALLNYQNDPDTHTLEYVGDSMVDMDKARYFHQFEFRQVGRLQPEDGAIPTFDDFEKLYADWELTETTPSEHPDAQDHLEDLNT